MPGMPSLSEHPKASEACTAHLLGSDQLRAPAPAAVYTTAGPHFPSILPELSGTLALPHGTKPPLLFMAFSIWGVAKIEVHRHLWPLRVPSFSCSQ